jgi:hypothetical protein
MKTLSGFKTVTYGVLLALISVFSSPELQAYVGENLPWIGGIAGGVVVLLRSITDSPIFKK